MLCCDCKEIKPVHVQACSLRVKIMEGFPSGCS